MIDLATEKPDLETVIDLARHEPVLLLTPDGGEFCIAQADDFEREVEALRNSPAFQRFLDKRSRCKERIPLEKIQEEIERELGTQ
jgi:hypothetical protein